MNRGLKLEASKVRALIYGAARSPGETEFESWLHKSGNEPRVIKTKGEAIVVGLPPVGIEDGALSEGVKFRSALHGRERLCTRIGCCGQERRKNDSAECAAE